MSKKPLATNGVRRIEAAGAAKLVPCPRSKDTALHFARREELAANSGVCKKCYREIRKHTHLHSSKVDHVPVRDAAVYNVTLEDNHSAWIEPGHLEPVTELDWDAIDKNLFRTNGSHDKFSLAGEALARIFVWVWNKKNPKCALSRFTALTIGIRPDLLDGRTQTDLAHELGVTKQAFSECVLAAERTLKTKFSRHRTPTSRAHMSSAAKKGWERRHAKNGNGNGHGT